MEKDFRELASVLEGRWDNERHGFFASDAGLDAQILAPRKHTIIRRLNDETADFASFEVTTDDDSPVTGFQLSIDEPRDVIVQTHADVACETLWKREAGQFRGRGEGDCGALYGGMSGDGAAVIRKAISPTEFWITVEQDGISQETRYRRARMFSCWISVLRGASHGNSGEGLDDWQFWSGVTLHDQGGEAVVTTDEETARTIGIKLRDVEWTYGTNRPSLVIYIHEDDRERATSYAWTSAGADRIGINLRWIQASCTRDADLDLVSAEVD
ncbi:MAG: hypothetical protein AAFV54_07190 [Pseudomonadota bacterium]